MHALLLHLTFQAACTRNALTADRSHRRVRCRLHALRHFSYPCHAHLGPRLDNDTHRFCMASRKNLSKCSKSKRLTLRTDSRSLICCVSGKFVIVNKIACSVHWKRRQYSNPDTLEDTIDDTSILFCFECVRNKSPLWVFTVTVWVQRSHSTLVV